MIYQNLNTQRIKSIDNQSETSIQLHQFSRYLMQIEKKHSRKLLKFVAIV